MPASASKLTRSRCRRSIPRVLSSFAIITRRRRNSAISQAKRAKMPPANNQPGTNPNHKPRAASIVVTSKANDEYQFHLCQMASSQPKPRMMIQTEKDVNPLWAKPHASDADEIKMLDKIAANVTKTSLGASTTNRQPDRTEWTYPTRRLESPRGCYNLHLITASAQLNETPKLSLG